MFIIPQTPAAARLRGAGVVQGTMATPPIEALLEQYDEFVECWTAELGDLSDSQRANLLSLQQGAHAQFDAGTLTAAGLQVQCEEFEDACRAILDAATVRASSPQGPSERPQSAAVARGAHAVTSSAPTPTPAHAAARGHEDDEGKATELIRAIAADIDGEIDALECCGAARRVVSHARSLVPSDVSPTAYDVSQVVFELAMTVIMWARDVADEAAHAVAERYFAAVDELQRVDPVLRESGPHTVAMFHGLRTRVLAGALTGDAERVLEQAREVRSATLAGAARDLGRPPAPSPEDDPPRQEYLNAHRAALQQLVRAEARGANSDRLRFAWFIFERVLPATPPPGEDMCAFSVAFAFGLLDPAIAYARRDADAGDGDGDGDGDEGSSMMTAADLIEAADTMLTAAAAFAQRMDVFVRVSYVVGQGLVRLLESPRREEWLRIRRRFMELVDGIPEGDATTEATGEAVAAAAVEGGGGAGDDTAHSPVPGTDDTDRGSNSDSDDGHSRDGSGSAVATEGPEHTQGLVPDPAQFSFT